MCIMGNKTRAVNLEPQLSCFDPQCQLRCVYNLGKLLLVLLTLCSSCALSSSFEESSSSSSLSSLMATATTICPARCHCTDNNTSIWCISATLTWIPSLPVSTQSLVMHNNHIQHVYNYSFYGLTKLETLDLENNHILYLAPEALFGLYRLRTLKLGNNNIAQLPKDIFRDNRNLEELDLHGNYFSILPDYAFTNLARLRILNMSINHLSDAMLGTGFAHTARLQTLDFSWNYFSTIKSHSFQASLWWRSSPVHHLNLSYCNIRTINRYAFRELYKYQSLSLEGNTQIATSDLAEALQELEGTNLKRLVMSSMNISDVHSLFQRFQHKRLEFLDLSKNVIQTIPMRTFYYLTQLKRLDLSRNDLKGVGDYSGLSRLEELVLSYNAIDNLKGTSFEGLQTLKMLDLSHNNLVISNDEPFSDLWDLNTLDISFNNISSFSIVSGLENVQRLYLQHNHLPSMQSVSKLLRLQELDISQNNITEIPPDFFPRDHSPIKVNFSRNSISILAAGLFQPPSPEIIDLSHNKLTTLSNLDWGEQVRILYLQENELHSLSDEMLRGLSSLQTLDLSGNQLSSMTPATFSHQVALSTLRLSGNPLGGLLQDLPGSAAMCHLPKLTTLVMSNSQLTRIPSHLFDNMTSLVSLDLSHNSITRVSYPDLRPLSKVTFFNLSFNKVSRPDPKALIALKSLQVLDMSGNPYYCSCALMPFRNWLVSTKITIANIQEHSYVCDMPMEWRGVEVMSFHLQSQECSHTEMAVVLSAVSCTLLAIVMTILFGFYRYRWYKRKARNTRYSVIEDNASVQSTSLTNGQPSNRVWV